MENKALGKGLSALIPRAVEKAAQEGVISSLEIKLIKNNRFQPRQKYDDTKLEDLKASIKEKGILQPILVRPADNGYEVVAGERRLRAARALGLEQVPVVIKNVTDREALVLALVENIQREELNAIEEAEGFKRLIEEFNFTQDSVAESVGKDRSTIANLLRLLKLPKEVQDYVAQDKLSMGHARALLGLDGAKAQKKMADDIVAKGLSVRQVEAAVKRAQEDPDEQKPGTKKAKDRDIQILEEELSRTLGTKVAVENKNNKGKIVIEYYSLDDFDRIFRDHAQMKEHVLVLIKPDGMRKAIAGEVLSQFLKGDLALIGLKVASVSRKLAEKHYGHLRGQFFFKEIVAYLMGDLHQGAPVMAMVFTGKGAIKKCRTIAGATNPEEADPKSVRGKFGRITTKGVYENLVHVSSDQKEAEREIKLWFKSSEILKSTKS